MTATGDANADSDAWKSYRFSEMLVDESISYGIVQPGSHTEMNSVPVVRVNNVRNGRIETDDVLKVAAEIESQYGRTRLMGGELLITVVGTVGQCAIVPATLKGWNVARAISVARIKPGFDPRFVKYCFKLEDVIFQMYGNTNDTVQPTLNLGQLKSLVLRAPGLPEQRAIADTLSEVDNKIDLLRRQNQTLEAMAETLFRQWFAAPTATMDGLCKINALIDFNPTRKLAQGALAPYVEMAALRNDGFNPEGWYERPFSSGMKFVNGDTLLARITPCLENGKAAYITFLKDGEVAWGSTEYIVMRPRDCLHPLFAYSLARHNDFRDYAEGCLAGSSGRQRVELEHLRDYAIRAPSAAGIAEFNRLAAAIEPKLHANAEQIKTLSTLRDSLLPKLMSGEVRVAC